MIPESIVLELTNECNAKCIYCTNRFMKRKKGFMPDELFRKIIDECSHLPSLKRIEPQMHGEPTLHPHFINYIQHAKNLAPHVKINLISNGANLTKQVVQLVDHLDMSFNYADIKSFRTGTGLNMRDVINKLSELKQYKDKITIHFVLTKDTIGDYFKIKNMFPDFQVSINPLFNTWNGRIPDRNVYNFNEKIECERREKQLVILWNGDAVICCNDYEGETTKDIGNINDNSISELFDRVYNYKGDFCKTCNSNVKVDWCIEEFEEEYKEK